MSTRGPPPSSSSAPVISRVASMPSISGMRMSMSTTSGSSSRAMLDGLRAVVGLADDLEVVLDLEDHAEARAHEGLVVGDEDAQHGAVIARPPSGASTERRDPRADDEPAVGAGQRGQLAAVDPHPLAHPDDAVAAGGERGGRRRRAAPPAAVGDRHLERLGRPTAAATSVGAEPACFSAFVSDSWTTR